MICLFQQGKVQKSKRNMCTKPVPFNLSQPRIRKQRSTEAPAETAAKSGITLIQLTRQLTINTPNEDRLHTTAKQFNPPDREKTASGLKSYTCAGSKHSKNSNLNEDLSKVTSSVYLKRDLSTKQLDAEGADHKKDNKGRTLESARSATGK